MSLFQIISVLFHGILVKSLVKGIKFLPCNLPLGVKVTQFPQKVNNYVLLSVAYGSELFSGRRDQVVRKRNSMEVHPGNSHYPPLSFSGDFNANLAEGEGTLPPLLVCPPPAAKQTPKSPIQIRVKQLQLSDLFSQLNKLTNIF